MILPAPHRFFEHFFVASTDGKLTGKRGVRGIRLPGSCGVNVVIEELEMSLHGPQGCVAGRQSACLDSALSRRGWGDKAALYRSVFASVNVNRKIANARASAVVISHRTHADTTRCLSLLKASEGERGEIIFVSNGVPQAELQPVQQFVDVCVQLNCNTGAYVARNIGSLFASAPVLVFVEDDCIPYPDLLTAHLEAHDRFDCISVRGVYEPKTANPLNALAAHYDLGDAIFPQHVVAEGNASYRSDIFYAVGGWDDQISFGGGGTDLALRLLKVEPDMRLQIYYPKARIRHDYAVDENHLARKRARQETSFIRLQAKHGEYRLARWVYRKYFPSAGADHTSCGSPAVCTPRRAEASAATDGGRAVSLVVLDRAQRPVNDSMEAIATMRRPEWEVAYVSPAEFAGSAPEGIQLVSGCAGRERDAIAAAVKRAGGDIVLFADSATHLTADAIHAHVALYEEYDVVAVQGAVKAPDSSGLRGHEWYPQYEFPAFANLPVNVSYSRDFLVRAIQRTALGGTVGGAMISARLLTWEPDFRKQIFSPRPAMTWNGLSVGKPCEKERLQIDRPREWVDLMLIAQSLFGIAGIIPRHDSERERSGREAIARLLGEHHFERAVVRFLEAIVQYPEVAYGNFYLRFWSFLDISKILGDLLNGQPPLRDIRALFERYKREDLAWFSATRAETDIDALALGPNCLDRQAAEMLIARAKRIEESVSAQSQLAPTDVPSGVDGAILGNAHSIWQYR